MTPMISQERLTQDFLNLTAVSSESLDERRTADLLKMKLQEIGFSVFEDDAGQKLGGNAGNLYGFLNGTVSGEPLLFSAHMDTVKPGMNKKPILHEGGVFTSDGTTVLGADDAADLRKYLRASAVYGNPVSRTVILRYCFRLQRRFTFREAACSISIAFEPKKHMYWI